MAKSQDELRQIFNSGTATDADMDEYINAGYDYNVLGPKSKELYDQRKSLIQPNSSSSVTTANADTPESDTTSDPRNLKKQLREQYANDNEGYTKALKDNNIAVSNPSGKIRSIQQAYYDGGIDKSTRDYMMADAIAKFARNTGRDIGNIGAQFTGGTINNNYETPAWNDRNAELFNQQTSSEAAGIKGSDKNAQRRQQNANAYGTELSNERNNKILDFSRNVKSMAAEARRQGDANTALILDYLGSSAAGGNLNYADLASALAAGNLSGVVPGTKTQEEAEKEYDAAVAREYPFEQFQRDFPGTTEDDYKEYLRLFKEDLKAGRDIKGTRESDKYIDRRVSEIKAAEKERAKAEKEAAKAEKEAAKAAQQFNDAVNYFTTDQKVINAYPTLRGFDPNNPTPEQIQLLKRIASSRSPFNSTEKNYAKAYLTKMGFSNK